MGYNQLSMSLKTIEALLKTIDKYDQAAEDSDILKLSHDTAINRLKSELAKFSLYSQDYIDTVNKVINSNTKV